MAGEKPDDMLREAAKARGFRLVKSRRRKPGGDFGLYGLVDLKTGRECLGFGKDGLTATAEQVHAYLRGGEVAAWKRSLIGAVAPGDDGKRASTKAGRSGEPKTPPGQSGAAHAPKGGPRKETTAAGSSARPASSSAKRERADSASRSRPAPPEFAIREATRRDATALARLLKLDSAPLAERLAAAIRAEEPPLLAERDGLVGAAAWTVVPTLQHGPRGRITLLFVAEDERRQGIGGRLLREIEQRLADAGVSSLEMSLDIDFDAPTAFLRRTGWTRTANGYRKIVGPPDS